LTPSIRLSDSNLLIPSGNITMVEIFSLVFVRQKAGTKGTGEAPDSAGHGDGKIEGPQRVRTATIPVVIRYLTEMRDQLDVPVVRRNTDKTIAARKRLGRGAVPQALVGGIP
jgi:hypothetical protein